jgi:hypothetical protein
MPPCTRAARRSASASAVLAGKGVIAWQRALAALVPAARTAPAFQPAPAGAAVPLPAGLDAELVSALAALALSAPLPPNETRSSP